MPYRRIEAFPENAAATLGSSEHEALRTVWREKREALEKTGVFQDFLKKLQCGSRPESSNACIPGIEGSRKS